MPNKYIRECFPVGGTNNDNRPVKVDVYNVLLAFDVTCPARQHAIKKLLCAGIRGKGDSEQDLTEARQAIDRAIELHKQCQFDARKRLPPAPMALSPKMPSSTDGIGR